ncbi:MAG: Nif3-like dinuclear metal center hexameric protein [Bacteroidetes bacterium HGW-Bacteroidetes-4]|nr:MAG: Nif3-like dinuclear metal center hexameric protein [Bacteroidetes bacterium HGW-Bacteroidetes-4]
MRISDITNYLETLAPLSFQESYDNAGLILGDASNQASGVLITLDVTEAVVEEAIALNVNLIIAHHPIVFSGLKKITGKNYVERTLIKAIKNDVAIYAAHTNLDSVLQHGVNTMICQKLGLKNTTILDPVVGKLLKLVVFVPENYADKVRNVLFKAGAGTIGAYDSCSFNSAGTGTFKAGETANPFVGEKEKLHREPEVRIEVVLPEHLKTKVIDAMIQSHPYEEVAYDIYRLENAWSQVGSGMIGELETAEEEANFLHRVKHSLNTNCIRHTELRQKPVKKVAVCGGAGSFLLKHAIKAQADVFISGDFKYHQFFDADGKILIADVGHFESEQFTKELFYELLMRKFSNFAIHFTKVNTNPIKYL